MLFAKAYQQIHQFKKKETVYDAILLYMWDYTFFFENANNMWKHAMHVRMHIKHKPNVVQAW